MCILPLLLLSVWTSHTQWDSAGLEHGSCCADSGLEQKESGLILHTVVFAYLLPKDLSGKLPVLASCVVQMTFKVVKRAFSNLLPSLPVCWAYAESCTGPYSLLTSDRIPAWGPEPHGRPWSRREVGVTLPPCWKPLGLWELLYHWAGRAGATARPWVVCLHLPL